MCSFILIRGGQIATESMSGQRRPEEGADCSAAPADGSEVCYVLDGWVCSLCVCTVYMGPDCQTPYIETARVHGWVQEMTAIMPNVPFASVSLLVMDKVCNRVEMWPLYWTLLSSISLCCPIHLYCKIFESRHRYLCYLYTYSWPTLIYALE